MLRYVFGLPGTGKTAKCIDEILKAQEEGRSGPPLVYIVPEQFSLESEKLLLERSGGRGLMRAQVLSFNRMAYGVFRETGRPPGVVLDDIGRYLIIRKVLLELESEGALKYYRSKAMTRGRGFVGKAGRLINECFRYRVTPEMLDCDGGEALKLRLADLRAVYGRFTGRLENNYAAADSLPDALAAKLAQSSEFEGARVWIDGFKSFTPQELNIIAALIGKRGDLTAALTVDHAGFKDNFNGFVSTGGRYEPFYETRRTINALSAAAVEQGANIGGHVFLEEYHRYGGFPEGRHFATHFFIPARYTGRSDAVCIRRFNDIYDEIDSAAREITALTRDFGYRWKDIGVVVSDLNVYGHKVKNIFARYGIALFIDERQALLAHPLSELCRASLGIIYGGYTYENVFRAVRTGLLSIPREDADILENYILAQGITTYRWNKEWTRGFTDADAAEKLNGLRLWVLSVFGGLTGRFGRKKAYPASDFCQGLYEFLEHSGARAALESLIDRERGAGRLDAAQTHVQTWARLMDILDRTMEFIGQETVTADEFSSLLEAGLESVSAGLAPPSMDYVTAGDFARSRLSEVRALFALGLNDGLMPSEAAAQPSGLLSDEDREALKKSGTVLAGTRSDMAQEERFNVYQILLKASKRLYLSCLTAGPGGKTMRPSQAISSAERMFGISAAASTAAGLGVSDVTSAGPMTETIFSEPSETANTAVYRDVYTLLTGQSKKAAQAARIRAEHTGFLTYDDISSLYGTGKGRLKLRTSATRLESYVGCPFKYYAGYNLGLKERKLYRMESYDAGSALHMALDKYTRWLTELDTGGLTNERRREAVLAIVDETAAECMDAILKSSDRYRYIAKRLGDTADASAAALTEQLSRGDFRILSTETAFEGENALRFDLGGGKSAEISGRIDRTDILEKDGIKYIKIIDYKSGADAFSLADLCRGLKLQLIIYLFALINSEPSAVPAGAFYFNIADHTINYAEGLSDGDARAKLFEKYRMTGVVSSDLSILKSMDRDMDSKSPIIPAALKKDGEFTKSSTVMSPDDFNALMRFSAAKISEVCNAVLSGDISPAPLVYRGKSACDFCPYPPLCGKNGAENARFYKKLNDQEVKSQIQNLGALP